jgi:hypothetical protein
MITLISCYAHHRVSGTVIVRPNWLSVMPPNKSECGEIEQRMAELEGIIDKLAGPDDELAFLGRGEKSLESAAKYLIERSLQGCIDNPMILGAQEELQKDLEGCLERW